MIIKKYLSQESLLLRVLFSQKGRVRKSFYVLSIFVFMMSFSFTGTFAETGKKSVQTKTHKHKKAHKHAKVDKHTKPKGFEESLSKHFRFQFPKRWQKIVDFLSKHAEEDLHELEKQMGYRLSGQLTVRLAAAGPKFTAIQPHRWQPHSWVAGVAYPHTGIMTLRIGGAEGLQGLHQTFRHELSHLLLARASAYRSMPLWFIEGIAMLQSQDFGFADRFYMLNFAKWTGQLPKMKDLNERFPSSAGGAQLAYATSFEFVAFLHQLSPGFLPQLLADLRKGKTFDKSLPLQMGWTWENIDKKWRNHLNLRYHWFYILFHEGLLWIAIVLFFLYAYRKAKKQRRLQYEQMDSSESF